MELLIISFCILLGTVVVMALAALVPSHAEGGVTMLRNIIGPCGIISGCVVGLCALFTDSFGSTLVWQLPWGLPIGTGCIGLDALTRIFLLPIFSLGAVCTLAGAIALRHCSITEHNMGAHWFFFGLLVLGLELVCTARDAVVFILAWEVMSVSPFFLIDFNDEDAQVREASWIYLVAAHLGAVCLLALFALLWQASGSTNFAVFAIAPATGMGTAVFIMALLGFGAKAGIAPMHVWLPEAHPAAPSHISAFLSGAMINAGIYGIVRLLDFFTNLHAVPLWWGWLCIALGIGSGLAGVLKAMAQPSLKRMLAYSSVENMGILLLGIGITLIGLRLQHSWIVVLAFCGMLLHMLNHAAFKSLLFLCAGEILHGAGTIRLGNLGGLQKRMPRVGFAFAIGTASIACLPPFNGFFGEFLLVLSLGHGLQITSVETALGLLLTLSAIALIGGFAVSTFTKAYGIVFLGEPRSGAARYAHEPQGYVLLPLLLPLLGCVSLGFLASLLLPWLVAALPVELTNIAPIKAATSRVLVNAAYVSLVFLGLVGAFFLWRRWLLRGSNAPQKAVTWSCGFQKASARIQYTGSSFSEPTSRIFGPLMGLQARMQLDTRLFPAKASLSISRPDRVRVKLLGPLFEAIMRLCDTLKIIQHGRIHLYILYMLVTIVVLLVWGL